MINPERFAVVESNLNHLENAVHELHSIVKEQTSTVSTLVSISELNQQAIKHEADKLNRLIPIVDKLTETKSTITGGYLALAAGCSVVVGVFTIIGVIVAIKTTVPLH